MQHLLKLTALIILFCGCNAHKTKYPYSINDFRPELRKHLEKVVEMGIAGAYYSKEFNEQCSVGDLKKLLQCEHPLIRAQAFTLLARKDTSNIKELLLSSLYDTATISVDHGEWGIPRMYCADYCYSEFRDAKREKGPVTLDLLVEKHPYLNATIRELSWADSLPERYHPKIKQIATNIFKAGSGMGNGAPYITYDYGKPTDILYALSKYKSKNDVQFIKEHLNHTQRFLWKIIQDNPDSAYFNFVADYYDELEKAYKNGTKFMHVSFFGYQKMGQYFEKFLIALSKYKNKESAKMFSQILTKRLCPFFMGERPDEFECLLHDILKSSYCDDYKSMIQQLKPFAENFKKKYHTAFEESIIREDKYEE
jgi:hypothetical protein